ncbi:MULTISPECIES: glycosyltransferase [unclassified Gluconobacter]|uniref:glycosyltransferase n=1 Tax=unclassified Gluconobacter TaxID=2644261 RepID=UPI001C043203
MSSDKERPDLTGTTSRAAFGGYGHEVTDEERAEWREVMNARAQNAFRRGQEAMQTGRLQDGLFWLERAERMARQSPNVTWAVALAYLKVGRIAECLVRMEQLYNVFRLREAAFLSAVCLARQNRTEEAAARLGKTLSCFHILPELQELATNLAKQTGLAGWCTASNGGWVDVQTSGIFRILLDGMEIGRGVSGRYFLPVGWPKACRLEVRSGRKHVLGSPINIQALTRCESLVQATANGLEGWLWYPAEPDHVPSIRLGDGDVLQVPALATNVDSDVPLSRPRVFAIPKNELPTEGNGLLMVTDDHGRPLSGAPVDPLIGKLLAGDGTLPSRLRPVPVMPWKHRPADDRVSPGCAIVIPVYRDKAGTLACLQSVLKTVPADVAVIVVDDATPEPALAAALDNLAAKGQITLLRHERNLGFPTSANDGMRQAGGRDVILLNSDTLVFPGWVERLRARMNTMDVGTLTPFSNDASILSYPAVDQVNDVPSRAEARELDRLCLRQFSGMAAKSDLPTGNGFCMAITAHCLAETGFFREDLFGQGYGEENDFCLRASALGFRHFPAPDVYVAHVGSVSFGSSRKALMARNLDILNALHPGYDVAVAAFLKSDPLLELRRALDVDRLQRQRGSRPSILLVQHDAGGGVGRAVHHRAAEFERQGLLPLGLRPTAQGCLLEYLPGGKTLFPNLTFKLPEELPFLVDVLSQLSVQKVEWHHLVGHAPCIRTLHHMLNVPYDIFIHDHIWFCPRISLLNGDGRYCGEPEVVGCEACIDRWGGYLGESITVPELIERSEREFRAAEQLLVPSRDTAQRMSRHFPDMFFCVTPLEDDAHLLTNLPDKTMIVPGRPLRICIVGGLSQWKGYDVLLAMAHHVSTMPVQIELILVGHTPDDDALIAAGVKVTGEYREDEAVGLVREQYADIGFIPSVAPETWCYALGLLWKSGLPVVCFDIGAQSERVRRSRRGGVVPLGMPVGLILAFILRCWREGS